MSTATKPTYFITGTDTTIGKTWCTLALIQHFKNQGLRVAGMKPIASGCYVSSRGLRSDDAEQILAISDLTVPYNQVNTYAFAPPIAPHLAAAQIKLTIDIAKITAAYQQLAAQADVVIVEGVGGWRIPINATQYLTDIVQAIGAKVILIVGMRLGCINHALLTAETIVRDGCQLAGWISVSLDPDYDDQATIQALSERIAAPLLAQMPCLAYQEIEVLTEALRDMPLN